MKPINKAKKVIGVLLLLLSLCVMVLGIVGAAGLAADYEDNNIDVEAYQILAAQAWNIFYIVSGIVGILLSILLFVSGIPEKVNTGSYRLK